MMSGDELYPDEVTSPTRDDIFVRVERAVTAVDLPECCWWCEDWAMGMDPEPCPTHHEDDEA